MNKINKLKSPWHFDKTSERFQLKDFKTIYQPIVLLSSGEIIGWEALTRINNDTSFRFLYDITVDRELAPFSPAIDLRCLETAILSLGRMTSRQKIFLNIQPQSLGCEPFQSQKIIRFLQENGIKPYQAVFEISCRNRFLNDVKLQKRIDRLRNKGFQFSLDDVGAGQSDIRWIADIRPDYLKIDRQFYFNIHLDIVKKHLLESLVGFAGQTNITIIAERLESLPETEHLIEMGVQCGQGYYFSRPAFPKKQTGFQFTPIRIQASGAKKQRQLMRCRLPIGQHAVPAPLVSRNVTLAELSDLLQGAGGSGTPAIVYETDGTLGLITSEQYYRVLCTQIGKPETTAVDLGPFMETDVLALESGLQTVEALKLATRAETGTHRNHLIVVDDRKPVGIVDLHQLQDVFLHYQVEEARDANPLTGIPGNLAIRQALDDCYRVGCPISLIYVDLDHFKAYNDSYGFEKGDRMLLQLSQILSWSVKRKGKADDFLGHIGGDDFVIITKPERAIGICQLVIDSFPRLLSNCYDEETLGKGHVTGKNRDETICEIPLVSVSLAIVDCRDRSEITDLPERAATMKQYAKTIPGSAYVYDRRKKIQFQSLEAHD
ncbi:MAG: EAL domain-containing protein [Thermodesulfobacteriota bacterium]